MSEPVTRPVPRGPIASFPWRPGASGPALARKCRKAADAERKAIALAEAIEAAKATPASGPITSGPLERLGFEIAAARLLEVKPRVGVLLSDLMHAYPQPLTYEQWFLRRDFPGQQCSRNSLPVHLCALREALDDIGLPGRVDRIFGVALVFVGDVQAVAAAVRGYA